MASTPVTLKRSDLKHFLDTSSTATPTWSAINLGVTAAQISYNPTVLEEGYIADTAKTKEVESVSPEMSLEFTIKKGDSVSDYIFSKIWDQKVLGDSYSTLLTVRTAETAVDGAYPAMTQAVSISPQNLGNEAVTAAKMSVTLLFRGDPVYGTFKPSTSTFTAAT